MNLAVKSAHVSPEDDGNVVVVTEGGFDDVVDVRGAGRGEEEDAEGGEWIFRRDFPEAFETRAHGEAGDLDFFGRKVVGDEALAGVLVGDEEVIAGGAGPGRVDLDGVGDDGDDGDTPPC